jgi:hypothetical protein
MVARANIASDLLIPAPIHPSGFPWYYAARFQDYALRHTPYPNRLLTWEAWPYIDQLIPFSESPASYYLIYAALNNARFWRWRRSLSEHGMQWVNTVAHFLQARLEARRAHNPAVFAALEEDRAHFEATVAEDHVEAYYQHFSLLILPDLFKIPHIPYLKCCLSKSGPRTILRILARTLPQIVRHWRAVSKFRAQRLCLEQPIRLPCPLYDLADSPLYWHARLSDCIERGQLIYPRYYEVAAAIACGLLGIFTCLSDAGQKWIVETQRREIEQIETEIAQDAEAFGIAEMSPSFDRDRMRRHMGVYELAGLDMLPWPDVALILQAAITSLPPETVLSWTRLVCDVQLLMSRLTTPLSTRAEQAGAAVLYTHEGVCDDHH